MTAKEKAKDLVDSMYRVTTKNYGGNDLAQVLAHKMWYREAVESALICVEEVIPIIGDTDNWEGMRFWNDVELEIEKL